MHEIGGAPPPPPLPLGRNLIMQYCCRRDRSMMNVCNGDEHDVLDWQLCSVDNTVSHNKWQIV